VSPFPPFDVFLFFEKAFIFADGWEGRQNVQNVMPSCRLPLVVGLCALLATSFEPRGALALNGLLAPTLRRINSDAAARLQMEIQQREAEHMNNGLARRQFPAWLNNTCTLLGGSASCKTSGQACNINTPALCTNSGTNGYPGTYCTGGFSGAGTCMTRTIVTPPGNCSEDYQRCITGSTCTEEANGDEFCRWDSINGDQCCFGDEFSCLNNALCVAKTVKDSSGNDAILSTCPFVADGSACNATEACSEDSYCNSAGVCATRPAIGQACGTEKDAQFANVCERGTETQLVDCRDSDTTCQYIVEANIKTIADGQVRFLPAPFFSVARSLPMSSSGVHHFLRVRVILLCEPSLCVSPCPCARMEHPFHKLPSIRGVCRLSDRMPCADDVLLHHDCWFAVCRPQQLG
jgi:hypothetical protein